jgi:uncharacterized delta-60 repeat protein
MMARPLIAFLALGLGLLSARAASAAGELDPAFGSGGKVTTDFGGAETGTALVRQPNGKLVVAGTGTAFMLARYLPDGALDSSFGVGGKLTDFAGAAPFALALQPDGYLVVAGAKADAGGSQDGAIARYDAAGNPDPTFGTGGRTTTDFGGTVEAIQGVVVQPDGMLVACGYSGPFGGPYAVALARYSATGTLDPTFGVGGVLLADLGAGTSGANAIALQPDGMLVVAGWNGSSIAVARFTGAGALDGGFGSGGVVTTPIGSEASNAAAVALDASGAIVAAGSTIAPYYGDPTSMVVVRYAADGTPDASFGGGDGIVTLGVANAQNAAAAVAVQPDGRVVVAGTLSHIFYAGYPASSFEVARLEADGTTDPGFGIRLTYVDTSPTGGHALVLQPDDKIVVAGVTVNDFALARYLGAAACGDGRVDPGEECDDGNTADGDCCSSTCTSIAAGTPCDDGNPCTDDFECDGAGTCQTTPNTAPCDDHFFCNGTDTCSGGSCSVHSGDPCTGGPECQSTCNWGTSACANNAGTPCTSDGNVCTTDECDGAGACVHPFNSDPCADDGNPCTDDRCAAGACAHPPAIDGGTCDDGDACTSFDHCESGTCTGSGCLACEACDPGVGCRAAEAIGCTSSVQPLAGSLRIMNALGTGWKLGWQWKHGGATALADFGDPETTDGFQLCMFDDTAPGDPHVLVASSVPPAGICRGKPCWKPTSSGFKYKNGDADVKTLRLKAGPDGTPKIILNARYSSRFPLPLVGGPFRVQLQGDAGRCWESTYAPANVVRNTDRKFKARSD